MNPVEALRLAHPELFASQVRRNGWLDIEEREPHLVTAEFYAGEIIHQAIDFFNPPTRTRKEIEDFTANEMLQFGEVVRAGLLWDVIEQMKKIRYFNEPPHGDNIYYTFIRIPEIVNVGAEKLFAIQIIPEGSKSNGDHHHTNPMRSENMGSLVNGLGIDFHEYRNGPVAKSVTLKPGEWIFIEPHEYHSVKLIMPGDSINLIVGMPLTKETRV